MKRIEVMIKPHQLSKVVAALHALPRFPGFTVFNAHGQGQGRGAGGHYAYGEDDDLLFHAQRVLVIICKDDEVHDIAHVIASTAHTGHHGDGIIAISDLLELQRIRDAVTLGDRP